MSSVVTHIIVIDTNLYAGNFERELAAYCTGQTGECQVGDRQAEMFREDVSAEIDQAFQNAIGSRADDRGTMRPSSIWATPGRKNDGVGNFSNGEPDPWPAYESVAIFFNKRPTPEMINVIKTRAEEYPWHPMMRIKGFRYLIETVTKDLQEYAIDHVPQETFTGASAP
jgi:hypothetical protein